MLDSSDEDDAPDLAAYPLDFQDSAPGPSAAPVSLAAADLPTSSAAQLPDIAAVLQQAGFGSAPPGASRFLPDTAQASQSAAGCPQQPLPPEPTAQRQQQQQQRSLRPGGSEHLARLQQHADAAAAPIAPQHSAPAALPPRPQHSRPPQGASLSPFPFSVQQRSHMVPCLQCSSLQGKDSAWHAAVLAWQILTSMCWCACCSPARGISAGGCGVQRRQCRRAVARHQRAHRPGDVVTYECMHQCFGG